MKEKLKEKELIHNLKDTKLKQNKGITLIALIITIIVLLILVGVSIAMLAGENGILKRTVDASESTKDVNEKEQLKLAVAEALTTGNGKLTKTELEESIEKMFGENKKKNLSENEEGSWIYKGERGNYKIGTTGILEEKDPDEPEREFSEIYDKTTKTTIDGITVTIPAGFALGVNEECGHVSTGLVITDNVDSNGESIGNEFVWIPINPNLTVVGTEKPMAKVSIAPSFSGTTGGLTNYEGVLYNYTGEGDASKSAEVPNNATVYGQGSNFYREPDVIPTNYSDDSYFLERITEILPEEASKYSSIDKFKKTMQEDYNKMIQSVKTNGGFYVSRYEMGVDGGKAISKSVVPTDNIKAETYIWYGLYGMAKTYKNTKKSDESSVESSMIWGSQYDAMLNYALTGSDKGRVTATGNGYYTGEISNSAIETGTTKTDKIINIYDLEGNLEEWTLEAYMNNYRVARGGYYGYRFSPSYRHCELTSYTNYGIIGSRMSLYVK